MTVADSTTSLWTRRYHPAPAATARLICFPHAGGSASYFHPLSARFAPEVDVVALQYPGRQDRRTEPCLTDIGELADLVTAEVSALGGGPTVFFGHSMGAVLAFETIRRLEQRDGPGPYALVASGRRGPSTHRQETVAEESDDALIREIKKLNGTSTTLLGDDDVLRMALPSLRGDYQAIEAYRCPADRSIHAPVTVLTGDADPKTTVPEASAWVGHTRGDFRLKVFPGGHFFLQDHQSAVSAEIDRDLRSVTARR
jgi:surfactin synthase thioesterase subunit